MQKQQQQQRSLDGFGVDNHGHDRLPPSTMTAAIFQNLSKQEASTQLAADKVGFQQLLIELLPDRRNGSRPDGEKDDVEPPIIDNPLVNFKIIQVMFDAGVMALVGDDPFGKKDRLLSQAEDSLALIRLSMQRTPEALVIDPSSVSEKSQDSSMGCTRLYLWLLPRVLSLLENPRAEDLQSSLMQTFEEIFFQLTSAPSGWHHCGTAIRYVRDCVESILITFKTNIKSTMKASFSINVPSVEFETELFEKGVSTVQDQSLHFSLSNSVQAASLIVKCFSIFSQFSKHVSTIPTATAVKDEGMKLLASLAELLDHLEVWDNFPKHVSNANSIRRQLLDSLSTAINSNLGDCDNFSYLAVRCGCQLLSQPVTDVDQNTEFSLASVILLVLQSSAFSSITELQVQATLYPVAKALMRDEGKWSVLHRDLKTALLRLVYLLASEEDDAIKVQEEIMSHLQSISNGSWSYQNESLQIKDDRLCLFFSSSFGDQARFDDIASEGRSKRRKIRHDEDRMELDPEPSFATKLTSKIYMALGNQDSNDLAGLSTVAQEGFRKLTTAERCATIQDLGSLPCVLTNSVVYDPKDLTSESNREHFFCQICDAEIKPTVHDKFMSDVYAKELYQTLDVLRSFDAKSLRTRIMAMLSLKRMLKHTSASDCILPGTSLAQWCLQSLHSTTRELRMAAAYTLPSFPSFVKGTEDMKSDRFECLNYVRELSSYDEDVIQETCVIAWSQLARVLEDEEFALALIRVVDYLGHKSAFIVGIAYSEFLNIATAKKCTPRRLISPFWREISISIFRQYCSKPQVAQLVCEIIEIDEFSFIKQTISYTLPYLVLAKKFDVIDKIVNVMRKADDELTVFSLCSEYFIEISAILLVQGFPDPEKSIMRLLGEISEDIPKRTDLTQIIRSEPCNLMSFILRSIDDDEAKHERVSNAIRLIAQLSHRPRTTTAAKKDRGIQLSVFLSGYVLGLLTTFSDIIHDVRGFQPIAEKKRSVRAIEEMIKLAKSGINGALPQLSGVLQSSMLNEKTRSMAFSAWATMMTIIQPEDVTLLLCLTFSLIIKYWPTLTTATQEQMAAMLHKLFTNHLQSIKEVAGSLPSFQGIEKLSEYEEKFYKWRTRDLRESLRLLATRCSDENVVVVEIALKELRSFLKENEAYVQSAAGNEIPDQVIAEVIRYLLNACVKYNDKTDIAEDKKAEIRDLCSICLGAIGAVDTNRVDSQRPSHDFILLHNFDQPDESTNFGLHFLEVRLVKSFLSATDTHAQSFLSHAMQEMLKWCNLDDYVLLRASAEPVTSEKQNRWNNLSDTAKNTLAPFLSSGYKVTSLVVHGKPTYPIFSSTITYRAWLVEWILDLCTKVRGQQATTFFEICSRIIKGQDVAIHEFLLPYLILHVIVSGTNAEREEISKELQAVLDPKAPADKPFDPEILRRSCETIFVLVDYLSRWANERKRYNTQLRLQLARQNNRHPTIDGEDAGDTAVANVEKILSAMPAKLMGERSFGCKSYARALFYWEQYIRRTRDTLKEQDMEQVYMKLQDIYAEIEEPDGLEGISTRLHAMNKDQQLLEHKKAGRWYAVQSWYEHLLKDKPNDSKLQLELLSSLKESGQYDGLLQSLDGMASMSQVVPDKAYIFAVEAAWMSSKWDKLESYVERYSKETQEAPFDLDIGRAIVSYRNQKNDALRDAIKNARATISKSFALSNTVSFRQCRESLFRLHILSEAEMITSSLQGSDIKLDGLSGSLENRLKIIEPSPKERQYLLALRRALFSTHFSRHEKNKSLREYISSTWLQTSKLARKAGDFQQSFNAILNATKLEDPLAQVEQARLLWTEGRRKKAIKTLESALASNTFNAVSASMSSRELDNMSVEAQPQSYAKAQAMLLWAKWLDAAGQSQSSDLIVKYRLASQSMVKWEKGHYYLGRHYNKILETEKKSPPNKKTQTYLSGETTKLVCQNYVRALAYGTKYIFQTLPRVLTLWLDLGAQVEQPIDPQHGSEEFRSHVTKARIKEMEILNNTIQKYLLLRIPSYLYLTAFPQIMSRICHPSEKIWLILRSLIVKVIVNFPQHGLWSLMAAYKSTQQDRRQRGIKIIEKLKENSKAQGSPDIRALMGASQKLVQELLNLCNAELQGKPTHVSLQEHLRFNHSVAPIALIVPLQSSLTVSFPPGNTQSKSHNPFARDLATIQKFDDDADVMNSLQKPRKIMILGSDGKYYPFLCKPKDDLRKDARLMEFNTIINRLLKKDIEGSKRQLLIRTYAVTPLNEECGLIEWVNNVRPLRDILLKSYRAKNIPVNYNEIRLLLDGACADPNSNIFTEELLPKFPPVFHEWFVDMFAEPAKWFASRLSFARTSAVMSMVGHILGLGDRHGENILFDETNGETLHVDFNCLFDKGLTFEKPERVPFRLTQNMVDALGVTGYEGPFRRSSETIMHILRQNEDSLMTVLETFLHDPLVEWMNTKKRRSANANKVPDNPKDVLETIQNKLRGLHNGEPVPLSVEGQVQELILQAVSPENLASMYIGWCAFF